MRAEPTIHEVMTLDLNRVEPQRRFGQTGRPIPATEVYRRVVSTLLRNGIRVERWILINEREQTVTYAITYNGITGAHYDPVKNTQWLSWDTIRSKVEDYQFILPDECPIAHAIRRTSAARSTRVA